MFNENYFRCTMVQSKTSDAYRNNGSKVKKYFLKKLIKIFQRKKKTASMIMSNFSEPNTFESITRCVCTI